MVSPSQFLLSKNSLLIEMKEITHIIYLIYRKLQELHIKLVINNSSEQHLGIVWKLSRTPPLFRSQALNS